MEKRLRSPNYPALSLPDAIEKVTALYHAHHTHSAPRGVAVKGMGYNSLNGASATAISALHKYGLLDRVGDEVKVSERALRILHPHSAEERAAAIQDAAREPPLFAELNERFPGKMPSDDLLRNYLIRNGFAPGAVTAVITAYRETSEMADREGRAHDSSREQTWEDDDMPSLQERVMGGQREASTGHETTFTPESGIPFQITYTPGGKIRIAGELTSRERADEFIKAIEALKLLMVTSEEIQRPASATDKDSGYPIEGEKVATQASVSLLITQEQKAALRQRGFSDEQIREMKPADAHRTLGLTN
jgi:hypothetical protein